MIGWREGREVELSVPVELAKRPLDVGPVWIVQDIGDLSGELIVSSAGSISDSASGVRKTGAFELIGRDSRATDAYD